MCSNTIVSEGPESKHCITQFQGSWTGPEDYCLLETLIQAYMCFVSLVRASKVKCSDYLQLKPCQLVIICSIAAVSTTAATIAQLMLGLGQDSVPAFAVARSFGESRCSAICAGLSMTCQRWHVHLSKFVYQKTGM